MNSTQQRPGATRWPWMAGVSLVAVVSLVWGFRLGAREGDPPLAKADKKDVPAKADAPPADPQQRMLQGQLDLMQEMLKSLQNPGGPTPADLNRIMQKAMQVTLAGQGQFGQFPAMNLFDG